jgi:hypothetical protein
VMCARSHARPAAFPSKSHGTNARYLPTSRVLDRLLCEAPAGHVTLGWLGYFAPGTNAGPALPKRGSAQAEPT